MDLHRRDHRARPIIPPRAPTPPNPIRDRARSLGPRNGRNENIPCRQREYGSAHYNGSDHRDINNYPPERRRKRSLNGRDRRRHYNDHRGYRSHHQRRAGDPFPNPLDTRGPPPTNHYANRDGRDFRPPPCFVLPGLNRPHMNSYDGFGLGDPVFEKLAPEPSRSHPKDDRRKEFVRKKNGETWVRSR